MLETFFLTVTIMMSNMYVGSRYATYLAKSIIWLEIEAGKASVFKKGKKLAIPFNYLTIWTKKMGEILFSYVLR